jgi:hypothetical protein
MVFGFVHSLGQAMVRPSRRPLRDLLRMTFFFNAIINSRHPEERPALRDAASRRLLRMMGVRLEGRITPMQPF